MTKMGALRWASSQGYKQPQPTDVHTCAPISLLHVAPGSALLSLGAQTCWMQLPVRPTVLVTAPDAFLIATW